MALMKHMHVCGWIAGPSVAGRLTWSVALTLLAFGCGGRVQSAEDEALPDAADTGAAADGSHGGESTGVDADYSGSAASAASADAAPTDAIPAGDGFGGYSGVAGSSGISGSSGSSGTSGGSEGDSGAAECNYLAGDDPTCRQCILSHCSDTCSSCESEPSCTLFLVCFLHCPDSDQACLASCGVNEPDGAAFGTAYVECMRQFCDIPCTWIWPS